MSITDYIFYFIETIATILLLPLANHLCGEWFHSFRQWQKYERQRMSEIEQLYERLGEWKEVADRIDNGEHPYAHLTDELTQKFGVFAHGMIQYLEKEITRLKTESGDKL